jgi:hypothetical protein
VSGGDSREPAGLGEDTGRDNHGPRGRKGETRGDTRPAGLRDHLRQRSGRATLRVVRS